MTFLQIQQAIATYQGQTSLGVFTINSLDFLKLGINNAMLTAQRARDFSYSETDAFLSVASTGAALTSATTTAGGATPVSVKRVQTVSLAQASSTWAPIEFITQDEYNDRLRRQIGRQTYDATDTLAEIGITDTNAVAYQQGQTLYLAPSTLSLPVSTKLDVVKWLTALSADGDTNFITDFGGDYLVWQGMLETNKYWRRFAQKQEGNIDEEEITTRAKEALATLLRWDDDIRKGTSTPPPEEG